MSVSIWNSGELPPSGFDERKGQYIIGRLKKGKVLLVGEGNLSFAASLINAGYIPPHGLVASTYEGRNSLSMDAVRTAVELERFGVETHHSVDARKLASHFPHRTFATIIFQFPHTGTRGSVMGRNPNFQLLRQFLISARSCLSPSGQVLVSHVDSHHYNGAFQFHEAATRTGFLPPRSLVFDRKFFPGYAHSMTHRPQSGLNAHRKLLTKVFKPDPRFRPKL